MPQNGGGRCSEGGEGWRQWRAGRGRQRHGETGRVASGCSLVISMLRVLNRFVGQHCGLILWTMESYRTCLHERVCLLFFSSPHASD